MSRVSLETVDEDTAPDIRWTPLAVPFPIGHSLISFNISTPLGKSEHNNSAGEDVFTEILIPIKTLFTGAAVCVVSASAFSVWLWTVARGRRDRTTV